MSSNVVCYIALGGNLDDPALRVENAFDELHEISNTRLIARSHLYSTKSVPPGNPDYINAVAKIETQLNAFDLLKSLHDIENKYGRVRVQKWGSRTLDLDLLLYGNEVIAEPTLSVPHPHMKERSFVLYPLADIAPDLIFPCGTMLKELLNQIPPVGIEIFKESTCLK